MKKWLSVFAISILGILGLIIPFYYFAQHLKSRNEEQNYYTVLINKQRNRMKPDFYYHNVAVVFWKLSEITINPFLGGNTPQSFVL
ncbi:hypothetical protein [Spiroplasma poulsonii]|uniref:hypothetical protein n=1 Tax=Spiroplasma poulsonii TaxID=2138 RepID=UPI001F4CC259|nr:hypothetical protein [Spiroplasma poulsonii]UNF62506.1 hypothetical protein MNU24_03340 [Spiroplasma poulsonii]